MKTRSPLSESAAAGSQGSAVRAARRRAPRLLLLVLSSLVSLLAADLAVRALFRSEVDAGAIAERNARTSFGAFTQPSRVPGLVYELRPGTRRAGKELPLLAISEHGPWRVGDSGELPVDARAVRIAVLGDSTSFGWSVAFEASYPQVLRRFLESNLGLPVAVRNFSVPGYNSEQERMVLERWAAPWQPHLLVIHYDHNDWEPAIREKPASYLDPQYGDTVLRSALLKLLMRRLRIARETERRESLRRVEHRTHEGYAWEGALYDRHLEELRRIAEIAAAREIRAVCLVFDAFLRRADASLEGDHYRLLHRDLVVRLRELGFIVLDLFQPYQRLMAEEGWRDLSPLWIAADDAHPNEIGHELIAQALAQQILGSPDLRRHLVGAAAGR